MLVNASRVGVGDRHRRAAGPPPRDVVGTRTFGKGVFQEIEPLSNGGALDITVGEYFTARAGATSAAAASSSGAGIKPDVKAEDDPKTPSATRRSTPRSHDGGVKHRPAATRRERAARGPVVAVLERRGRFLTADAVLRARAADQRRPPRPAARGRATSCWSRRPAAAPATGEVLRRIGRPDVARDVLEALMLDRGLRRRFDPLVEREAREAAERAAGDVPRAATCATCRRSRSTRRRARDFDDAISAERLDGGAVRVWVHIADVAAHVPPGSAVDREAYRRATSVYVPGAVEPMLPEALSNRRLLAGARTRTASR